MLIEAGADKSQQRKRTPGAKFRFNLDLNLNLIKVKAGADKSQHWPDRVQNGAKSSGI